jgi:hypothetical protein
VDRDFLIIVYIISYFAPPPPPLTILQAEICERFVSFIYEFYEVL